MAEAARREGEQVRPARRGADGQGEYRDPVTRRWNAQGGPGRRGADGPDRHAPRHVRHGGRRRGRGVSGGLRSRGATTADASSGERLACSRARFFLRRYAAGSTAFVGDADVAIRASVVVIGSLNVVLV